MSTTVISAAAAVEVSAAVFGCLVTVIIFLGGIVIRKMQKDIESNTNEVKTVKDHAQERLDEVLQIHNDELRQHEDADRKRASRVYERLEEQYVKKETLGIILQTMSDDISEMKTILVDRNEKMHELSEEMLVLKTKLGA